MITVKTRPGESAEQATVRHCVAAVSEGMCPYGHGSLGHTGACYPCGAFWHLTEEFGGGYYWCRFGHCNHERPHEPHGGNSSG